jgi:hypothetical protein
MDANKTGIETVLVGSSLGRVLAGIRDITLAGHRLTVARVARALGLEPDVVTHWLEIEAARATLKGTVLRTVRGCHGDMRRAAKKLRVNRWALGHWLQIESLIRGKAVSELRGLKIRT